MAGEGIRLIAGLAAGQASDPAQPSRHRRIHMTTARSFPLLAAGAILALCGIAYPWNPPTDTAGPLTVSIEPFPDVEKLDTPIPVRITLENKADEPLVGQLRIGVVDDWRVEGDNPRPFRAPAADKIDLTATVVPGPSSYAAHYPVHAYTKFTYRGEELEAHAIFITQVASVAVAPRAHRPQGLGSLVALKATDTITLDGDLTEWTKAVPVPLGEAQRSTGHFTPGDFGAILYLLHDGANLYVGLRVTDDDLSADDTTSRDFMDSDYVRIYLSANPPEKRTTDLLTEEDLVLAINPLAAGGPLVKIPSYELPTRELSDLGLIAVAPKRTAAGYDVEIAVPLSAVGEGLGANSTLGFNLMLGDADRGAREAEVTVGNQADQYWTNPRCYVPLTLSDQTEDGGQAALPVTVIAGAGATALDRLGTYLVRIVRAGREPKIMPLGWTGNDPETGASFAPGSASRPDPKPTITIHPPYRGGVGEVFADARLALPDVTPLTLSFFTAIRDNIATEPPSDGVEWRVYIAENGGEPVQVFRRFSASKTWEPAEVDLSAYAGKTITMRLWNGPGPAGNTTCDSGYWAEPTLIAGLRPEPETPEILAERRETALKRARAALRGQKGPFQWPLQNAAGKFGVGWAAGRFGFADGVLAFVTSDRDVVFEHFLMSIDGENVRDWRSSRRVTGGKAAWRPDFTETCVRDFVQTPEGTITIETSMSVEKGAFRLRFSMPDAERSKRGEPRFTVLGVGPATVKARRVYAGFGNVIQDPEAFTLNQGGFTLSTRHIGVDFANGLSLVQASDVFPYRFVVNPDERLYSLQTGHDATLLLVPSTKGAFAAARVYRDVSGFKPAAGVAKLKGRMCIDWWGGHDIAEDIRRAGAYGLNDSVFIKHSWQRWGYDYRLPDIYPPNCDPETWNAWIAACHEASMLFGVHDNYIDFYPDASGFSYRHILFNADGTPQRAWLNKGRGAQSYRWLPGAYWPWLERNVKLIKEGFAPTAYFIDVFSAIPLLDYYDQEGNFHTKIECAEHWGRTFDYVRQALGDNAPQISEAGHDGLIGHLDGCQSDHSDARQWGWKCDDAERTPWHDMATHGSLILFAGGLGHRYAGDQPYASWGSDDYLSNTIMGGRNPMCIGPCRRETVMTYWLQHDICKELANQSFEAHEFVGDNIHCQHTVFGGGGEVWVNRGDEPWTVQGVTLPKYGYLARSGNVVSSITLRDGLSVGYAHSPQATFVDSRPQSSDLTGFLPVKTRVLSARHLGEGVVEVEVEWQTLKRLPEGYVTFVHICHEKAVDQGERIALHAAMDLAPEVLREVGTHIARARFTLPVNKWDGDYYLRYGLYAPSKGGSRGLPIALLDDTRVRGGIFTVSKADGRITSVEYKPEVAGPKAPLLNAEGRIIDFGPIATNGAFRVLHSGSQWRLFPLQGSLPFSVELRLDRLGAKGRRVARVEGLSQSGEKVSDEQFQQKGEVLLLDLNAEAFSYRISFR